MTRIRSKLTYANVMASVAVFAALGGGAFAASQKAAKDTVISKSIKNGKVKSADLQDGGVGPGDLAADSVGAAALRDGEVGGAELTDGGITGDDVADGGLTGADLANGGVTGADLANGGITGADVADDGLAGADIAGDTLTGDDIDESTLGTVPVAQELGIHDSEDFVRHGGWLPPGEMMRGVWGGREAGAGNLMVQDYTFPTPTQNTLSDGDINFAAGGNSGLVGSDDDPTCTGTSGSPTAPPGKVCIYVAASDLLASNNTARGDAVVSSRRGFQVRGPSNAVGDTEAHGTWAFTAPE